MIFGILSTAAILTIIVGGRFAYKYYMTHHAQSRFNQRCKAIAPHLKNGMWRSITDSAGNRHNICYTSHGTADFVARGNQITTVMSNTNGNSLDRFVDKQIRYQFNIPFTADPEPQKQANPRRRYRSNFSPGYLTDNP